MGLTEALLTGGASVALVSILGKYLEFRWTQTKKVKKASDVIKVVSTIYQIMQKVVNETPVERFIILKAENGGGRPKVGAHLYATAVMESHSNPEHTIIDKYSKLRVDSHYIEMLSDIIAKEKVLVTTSNLPTSLLKTIYLAEAVKYSEIRLLHTTDDAIYYCSVATTMENEYFQDPSTVLNVELSCNKISEILKKNI